MELSRGLPLTYRAMPASSSVSSSHVRPLLGRMASLPSFPPQIALVGPVSERFNLTQPLVINLEQEDGGKIIASDDIFFMYGQGVTRQEALRDYISSLSEYYELLEGHQDVASIALFTYLQSYLTSHFSVD